MSEVKTKLASELMQKINALIGTEKELIVLKGKLFAPTEEHKESTGEIYYTFKMKVLKAQNEDEYAQSFNTYYLVMPAEISKRYSHDDIARHKNNEVLVLASAKAGTRTFESKEDKKRSVTVNNITLYATDIMLTREIDSTAANNKSLKL